MTKITEVLTKEHLDKLRLNTLKSKKNYLNLELNAVELELKKLENKQKFFVNSFSDSSKYKSIFENE